MLTVTVSDKGQVVIPVEIRRRLGITPGCQLDFSLDGNVIRVEVRRQVPHTKVEEGFGMLVCKRTGTRRLDEFDVAAAMRGGAGMIALDTNILARFYVDDPADPEAARQRPVAHRILAESPRLFVPLTVILELEWVLRAFYGFTAEDFIRVVKHLLGLPNVSVEEWPRIADALDWHADGLDFADALHLLASSHCREFLSFDDRRFARRATRLGIRPPVKVPEIESPHATDHP